MMPRERDLSSAFENSSDSCLSLIWGDQGAEMDTAAKELRCLQGRPDFVYSSKRFLRLLRRFRTASGGRISSGNAAKILSLLKPSSPRSLSYLLRMSGLQENLLKEVLELLVLQKVVHRVGTASYTLSSFAVRNRPELTAFELKVSNWRRALYQAVRNRAFAHRSYVVIHADFAHLIDKRRELFKSLGVGVISVDPKSKSCELKVKCRSSSPLSGTQYYYAIAQIMREKSYTH